jgi:bacterioferritin-associated ferredoxin
MLPKLMPQQRNRAIEERNEVTEKILQEYLQTLAENQQDQKGVDEKRAKQLLTSYAEFRFRLAGGSQCPLCRAAVRHVLPVSVLHKNAKKTSYECLCHRCIEAERDGAESIEIGMNKVKWVLKGRR